MQMSMMDTETGEMIVKRVSVPIGLEELMEGLTKEILLKKPDDIYLFAAEYFAQLLLLREKGGYKVKTVRTAQSVARQAPKQPPEKLIIRGASKQLSRQISVRGESPVKKVAPTRKPLPRKDHKDDKSVERSKFIDRKNKPKQTESAESKIIETQPKRVISRTISDNSDNLNKRDRSVSSSRRGRSLTKSVQSTPRQKSTSTPRRTQNATENDKANKPQSKDDTKQQTSKAQNEVKENTFVPKISSVEEDQGFIKDGKLAVTPPKIIKRPQVPESAELISSLIVPHVVENVALANQNIIPEKSKKEVADLNLGVAENKAHERKDEIATAIESTNKEQLDSQIKNEVTNNDQRNELVDETHNKINEDLNNTSSIDDFNSETKSIFSIDGIATPTNLSNVDDKMLNELKRNESVEKHDVSVNNSNNTSDDQVTNILTDDSSISEILDKEIEDKKLTKNEDKPLSNIEENDKSNSLVNEIDKDINVISNESSLAFSVSNGSDKIENVLIPDHQGIIKDESAATSVEPRSEVAEKNITSEGNKSEEKKSSTEEMISDSKNIESSENNELEIENQKKNNYGSSSQNILEEMLEKNVHQHDGDRYDNYDKDIKHDKNKEEPIKNINGEENIVVDSKKDSTDPDSHNNNNIDQNEKDSLKQQIKFDEGEIDNKLSDKGVDAEKRQIGLHENVVESVEREKIDLSIHNKENIDDQIEKNSEIVSSNLKGKSIVKHMPDIQSVERNLENDINLIGIENEEKEPIRVKREAVALNDSAVNKVSDGVKIVQEIESGENTLKDNEKDNINVKINANKIDGIEAEINKKDNVYLKEENAEEISKYEEKSHHVIQKSSDRLGEEQHDGTIPPDSNKNHLKDQDEISESEKNLKSDLTAEKTKIGTEQLNVVTTDEEKSNCVTDPVFMDEKKASSKGDDENTHSRTESEAKKAELKESSENNEELTSPKTNINVVENVEDILMTDKENTKELVNKPLIETVENVPETDKENTEEFLKDKVNVDNTASQRDKEINVITKFDDVKLKDTEEIDKNNEKSSSSISNVDTSMKEDNNIGDVNIIDAMKENEKAKIDTGLLESDNIKKNNEEIQNGYDENTSSQSEDNAKNIEESEQLQKIKSTISTDNVTHSSDDNKENSYNKGAEKQEIYTKIKRDPEAVYDKNEGHIRKSFVDETKEKTNVIETPINKNENNTVLAEIQSKNLEEERISSAIDTDHDKGANISNKEMSEDDNKKNNDTNSLSDLNPDKPTKMSELESKNSESDLQNHDSKDHCVESINSVINVAKEGPVDHIVKKYIGDFIQQEQQHVFVENSKQRELKDIVDESNNSKEIVKDIPVERNEVLINGGNELEPPKVETQDVDKATKNGTMKNIINSTISLAQTGKVDEILKVHIKDFLGNEKNNVFTASNEANNISDSLAGGIQKQITVHENESDIQVADYKPVEAKTMISESIIRKDSSKSLNQPETHSQKTKQSGKNIKSRSATQAKIKVTEENFKENNKNKPEKKLRRVKTVDVLTDLSKSKTEVRSRIPTADYRNRVKREIENGKHSILIKQTSNSQEVVNKLPEKVVDVVNKIDRNTISSADNKQDDKIVKEIINENIEHKKDEDAEVQQSSKDLKEAELYELNKYGFDNSKLREELKAVEAETKFATFKPSFNPYVLRQEIKNASVTDAKNEESIGNDEPDNFLTQIAAALKIQSVWRGFKVRKNKATPQQIMEPEAVIENKASQLMLQNDRNIKGKDVTETDLKPGDMVTVNEDEKVENDESKRFRPGSNTEVKLNSEENQNQKVIESSKLEYNAEDSKIPKQKTDIEMIAGNKDSQLLLQGHESNSIQNDSIAIEKQVTNTEIHNNESKPDTIKSENNQGSRVELNSQENQNQDQEHSKLENLHKDSNKINEDKFTEAAVMIQKNWRAFKIRKNMKQKSKDEKSNHKNNESFQENKVNKVNAENGLDTLKSESDSSESERATAEKFIKAAITIQKVWRRFKIRKNVTDNDNNKCNITVQDNVTESDNSKSKETPKQSRTESTETKTEMQSADFSLSTDDKFRKAALTIQKLWRGFKARKTLKQINKQKNSKTDHQAEPQEHSIQMNKDDKRKESIGFEQEVVNKKVVENLKSEPPPKISPEFSDPKNDNKLMRAATKIQTLWRGFQVRKANNKQHVSIDQGNIERNNETSQIIIGKSKEKLEKHPEAGKDEFIKAAIKIQKIWRGFKVRKVLRKGDPFGTRVESEKPVIESMKTEEEIHPKDKKSALKIQSLWRGYQVRKNINIIKDKLEENITANDVGKGKELTDRDILNAATKIQAGVRGYLQRKKYKRDVSNLKSIAEEDIEEKYDAKNEEAVSVTSELLTPHKSTNGLKEEASSESRQLSDDDVFKALEDLNKLEVPNDTPLGNEIKKPALRKSHSIQEPEIIKKQSSPLLQTASLSEINNTEKDTKVHNKNQTTEHFKDSNNNSSNNLTPLEMEVKEAIQNITKLNGHEALSDTPPPSYDEVKAKFVSDSKTLISKGTKQLESNGGTYLIQGQPEENTDSKVKSNLHTENMDKTNNKIQPDISNENILYEATNQKTDTEKEVADNHDTNKSINTLSKTELGSSISLPENQQTEVNKLVNVDNNYNLHLQYDNKMPSTTNNENKNFHSENHMNENINEPKNRTDLKFDVTSSKTESTNKTSKITPSEFVHIDRDVLPNDEQTSKVVDEKLIQERPVSIESTDSAVTVIDNELSSDNEEDNNENKGEIKHHMPERMLAADDNTKGTLLEHENLINDFQNKLLDEISGKNGKKVVEDVTRKFDIEQLRKELEEAGLTYNSDDTFNIQHQNSKEESNAHDQLFDYLHNLESAEPDHKEESNIILSPRDLPDIKEEDLDTKSVGDNILEKSNIVLDKNVKANILESIEGDKPGGEIDIEKLQSTLKECENIAHEINKGIKITEAEQANDQISTLKDVENDLPENKQNIYGKGTNHIESGTAFCAIPQGKTVGNEYIDNKPFSDHIEQVNVNTNSDISKNNTDEHIKLECDNIPTDLSSVKETDQTNPSSGSGLLHTGELHDSVLVSLPSTSETDSQYPDSLENMNTEISSQDVSLTSTAPNSKLLHTGEFHDTVVVPLPLKVKNDLKTEIEEHGNSIVHTTSNGSEQLDSVQASLPSITTETVKSEQFKSPENLPTTIGLLHTGELHDSVVVPISRETQHVLGRVQKEINPSKSTKIIPSKGELNESSQQNLSTNESQSEPPVPTNTRLLHTGELHDTVVIPMPAIDRHAIGTGNTEDGSDQPENVPRQVDSECQTTGQVHAVPIEVQLNQAPAGVAVLTSPRPISAVDGVSSVEDGIAQTPDKGALPIESGPDFSSPSDIQSMESETRKNATINNKSMEVEAATKIQAGFRGYQVRKQLKLKNGSSDINNQRRQLRRKSSGRLTDNGRISQNKTKDPNDIEEKSAVKIQAGVRGFLVRRRQKKQKTQES